MDVYEFVKNIGNGMFGQVYLAKHLIEQKLYAIKRINFQEINPKDRDNIENEVRLLQDLKHPNIVSYKDSFCDRENFFNIVMIYCDGGDFYNKIKNAKGKHFPETEIIDWLVQLGLALSYIHDKKILHRDLKTQNIFLKESKIRIGDFGIAKMFNHTKDLAGSMVGTPLYMSPEQYNGKKYGFKSDIWALGCCLYEMCNLKHAFEGLSWNAVAVKVLKGQHAPVHSTYTKELRSLIDQMLSINSKNRPTISTILEKPFIKKKVAVYIYDFIQSYKGDSKLEADEFQCDILKEQAEKLGLFNQIMKEINTFDEQYQNNQSSYMATDNIDISNFNSSNAYDPKYLNYLRQQQEEKRKIEEKILELEKQKKTIYASIKVRADRVSRKKNVNQNNESSSVEKRNFTGQVHSSEKKKEIFMKVGKGFSRKENDEDYSKLKPYGRNNNINFLNINPIKRPESNKKSFRKISHESDEGIKDVLTIGETKESKQLEKKSVEKKSSKLTVRPNTGIAAQVIRPLTGGNSNSNSNGNNNKHSANIDESLDDRILETIREESDDPNLIIERNKIMKLTQEIVKMKEYLEKTQDKIDKIEKKIKSGDKPGDNNNLQAENEINNNQIINLKDINKPQVVQQNIVDSDESDTDPREVECEEVVNTSEACEDDRTRKLKERIKFFRQRCESALGYKLFSKAYEYLKANRTIDPAVIREHLINLFGKNNIGFWQLLDQILFLEDLMNSN